MGIALLFSWRFSQIQVLRGVGLFEFALAMSMICVSSAVPTFLSPTLVVVLGLLGARATHVGRLGPFNFGRPLIEFIFVFGLPFVRMTFTRSKGFVTIVL